jgi:hypothetical protein
MALTELIFLARKLITELVGELRRNRNGGLRQ